MAWFVVEFDPRTKRYGVSLGFPSKDEAVMEIYRRYKGGKVGRIRVIVLEADSPGAALDSVPPIPED